MGKKIVVTSCCWLIVLLSFSQGINWRWAKGSAGYGVQDGFCVATDQNDNIYVAGIFDSTINLGPYTLLSAGLHDVFIAKYDSTGNLLWAREAGGSGNDEAYSIAVDAKGGVYVTGIFTDDSIIFGSSILHPPHTAATDFFIVKYDSSGNVIWAKSPGGGGFNLAYGVAVDGVGDVYITGFFANDSITFDSTTALMSMSPNAGADNIFIVKYNTDGRVIWAKTAGGAAGVVIGRSITTDKKNSFYVTGVMGGDSVTIDSAILFPNGADIFVGKYDTSGNLIWAKNFGGGSQDEGSNIAVDGSGDVYITGWFESDTAFFGNNPLVNANQPQSQIKEFFIAKLDAYGQVLWAKDGVSKYWDALGYCVVTDQKEQVYVTGAFRSDSISFGSTILVNPESSNGDQIFLLTLDSSGTIICSIALPHGGDDQDAISVDASGNALLASDYGGTTFILGTDTLDVTGSENVFLAKFNCSLTTNVEIVPPDLNFQIYPNPLATEATVKYALPTGSKNAALVVYDLLGREKTNYKLAQDRGQMKINLNNLSSGIYFCLLVVDGKTLMTKKIVVD